MKKIVFILLVTAMLGMFSASANALSEQVAPVNSDGTAKFADPDERAPAFLIAPNGGLSPTAGDPSSANVQAPSLANRIGTMGEGAQSFDRAVNHLQNQ